LIKTAVALKLDVYATISDKNKSTLTKYGISPSKVFVIPTTVSNSNTSRATNGQTFKLVLNTQYGQYAEHSHLIANCGTYIEIGSGEGQGLEPYARPNRNVMLASIDLSDAYHDCKEELGR
jgi:hypothetical protein